MKHTKGTWKVLEHNNGEYEIKNPINYRIAVIPNVNKSEENGANAKLIAQAPQLLKELIFCLETFKEMGMTSDSKHIQRIELTIAKATT